MSAIAPTVPPAISGATAGLAVEAHGVRRVYRTGRSEVTALDGVDLRVRRGELYGLLGPNGAGKTTLIKILVTLLAPSSGTARVDGLDVTRDLRALRPRIAMVSGGENSGYGILTVREQLWMFSQFYGMRSGPVRERIDELLERLGLYEARDRRITELSSGMRQKMNLIRGLITDPRVLFLDEPTVALDVGAARDVRREVRRWMAEDPTRTVILTTHYMAEADELCDRISIVNRGRIIATGTPAELKASVSTHTTLDIDVSPGAPLLDELRAVDGVAAASATEVDGHDRLSLLLDRDSALTGVVSAVQRSGRSIVELRKREPSLEDAFVRLVGRSMGEEEAAEEGAP